MPEIFRPLIIQPSAIEAESFRIIDAELSPHFKFSREEHSLIRRVIHASADFEYAKKGVTVKRLAIIATRMKGEGLWVNLIKQRFDKTCAKLGFNRERVVHDLSRFDAGGLTGQVSLF